LLLVWKGKKFAFLAEFEWNLAFLIKAHPFRLGLYEKIRAKRKKTSQSPSFFFFYIYDII